jgi:ribosomal protein S18 acetylase RimI-like enzyme
MVIRPAVASDIAEVLALWRAAGAVPGATDDDPSVRALLAVDPSALLVADIDGRVAGTLIAAWDGWRGNMYRLAVLPEHRRAGVAGALVRAGEARLEDLGCRRITALVVGHHDDAVAFWSSAGYEHQACTRRYVR